MTSTASTQSGAAGPSDLDPEGDDLVRRVRLILRNGIAGHGAAILADVAYAVWVRPETRLGPVLAIRVALGAMFVVARYVAPPTSGPAAMRAMWSTGIAVTLTTAVLTHLTGGFLSLYPTSVLFMGMGAAGLPLPRLEALRIQITVWAAYGLGMAATLPLFPDSVAQLHESRAIATFLYLYLATLFSPFLSAEMSHALWSLRREIFESKRVGQMVLRRRIGRGGMGEVWTAWHRVQRREVAVKFLQTTMNDTVSRQRFERETRALSELTHENTVRVLDSGIADDGQPYLAMELLEGRSLEGLVSDDGPLAPARAVRLVAQAARALGEAHALGIVHRDVKPENLFVCSSPSGETIKVLDFGIASVRFDGASARLTHTGLVVGTPAYLAPEAALGREVSTASDVYALGAVLYFALTGTPPFESSVAASILNAHLREPVEPLERRTAGVRFDPSLASLVYRALEKDPEARYAHGDAFADALASLPELSQVSEVARPRADSKPESGATRRVRP